jgi:hypothetical protein
MNKKILPLKNYTKESNKIHYTQDPIRYKIALEKSRNTKIKNAEKNHKIRLELKRLQDLKLKLKVENSQIYSEDKTIELLSNDIYKKYIGKSKNLTMIKDDPSLYKSVLFYTKKYEPYCSGQMPLSCRVQLLGKFKLNVDRNYYCRCGLKLNYDKSKQIFTYRGFCRKCIINPNAREWFKYKYSENWEIKYNEYQNNEIYIQKKKLRSRLSIQKKLERGIKGFINKGINETKILDYFESKLNIKIDRDFHVLGYHPDGYCYETNTIYEIYENHHLNEDKMKYDTKRQKEITDYLKCNFVIIYDNRKIDDYEKLEKKIYEIEQN